MEYSVATMIWRSLGDLITGKYGINDLSGPVGTMDIIGDAVAGANTSEGMMTLIMLVVMITVNVGIFNLLPLPALDGGGRPWYTGRSLIPRRFPDERPADRGG